MTSDNRMTWGLIIDVLDTLERHGYHKHDNEHTGQAIGVIHDLARVYEGDRDASYGTYLDQATPSPPPEPRRPSRQAEPGIVILTGTDISTVLTALYIAAEDNCDRAETCADCPDQSCPTCQSRLQAARAYDQPDRPATPDSSGPRRPPRPARAPQPQPLRGPGGPAAGIEAGQ